MAGNLYYWVPHLTEVWALARTTSSDNDYTLAAVTDCATLENEGDTIDVSDAMIRQVTTACQDVSDVFQHAEKTKTYTDLVWPLRDMTSLTGPDDVCTLSEVHEASVLHSLRVRYRKDRIYTNVGRIVIAMNPFTELPDLYSPAMINTYLQAEDPYQHPPHLFQVASAAYRKLSEWAKPQATLITGESGSGKTESTKLILRFLASSGNRLRHRIDSGHLTSLPTLPSAVQRGGSSLNYRSLPTSSKSPKLTSATASSSTIEDRILRVNPLLEAFGNARTSRNPNSSRFGKWIELHFDVGMAVTSGTITSYLLELPRVTQHMSGERNYHVFYQLLHALRSELASRADVYQLQPNADAYVYTTPTGTTPTGTTPTGTTPTGTTPTGTTPTPQRAFSDEDAQRFCELKEALTTLQFSPHEQDHLFCVVAAVLHLGNLEFEPSAQHKSSDGAAVGRSSAASLTAVATLLQIQRELVQRCIEMREVKTSAEVIQIPLGLNEAAATRDGLAKLIYGVLFDWIVYRANLSLKETATRRLPSRKLMTGGLHDSPEERFVGILDIAGFESFHVNGFEQLCINLSNEKLQSYFNWTVFQSELEDYQREGLGTLTIPYNDNLDIVELIEGKQGGLMALLDEELFVPRGSEQGFFDKLARTHAGHPRIVFPRVRGALKFTIKHFAGPVEYTVTAWLEKNSYATPRLATAALLSSTNVVVKEMCQPHVSHKIQLDGEGASGTSSKKPLRMTVGSHFRTQLQQLMAKISSTHVHYVRSVFCDNTGVVVGLPRCLVSTSGVLQAILIRKQGNTHNVVPVTTRSGYPVRITFEEFLMRFAVIYGRNARVLRTAEDQRRACQTLVRLCETRTSRAFQVDHICTSFGLSRDGVAFGTTRVFMTDAMVALLEQYRKMAFMHPATQIQAVWRGYRVRKFARSALALNKRLYPILGVGAAARAQGGGFLYPQSVILGVTTGEDLAAYTARCAEVLEDYTQLPEQFHPATLEKAVEIYNDMRREAEVISDAERLQQDASVNVEKLSMLAEKATKYNLDNHPAVSWVNERLWRIETELEMSSRAEQAVQNQYDAGGVSSDTQRGCGLRSLQDCESVMEDVKQYLLDTVNGQDIVTKQLRRAYSKAAAIVQAAYVVESETDAPPDDTVMEETPEEPLLLLESRVTREHGNLPEETLSGSNATNGKQLAHDAWKKKTSALQEDDELSDTTESSEWSWNSTETSSESEEERKPTSGVYAMRKFARELKAAMRVLDLETLDLLIERADQTKSLAARQKRELSYAKQLRINLDNPEWVLQEIKEAVVAVVWGTNDANDVARLTNLIERANHLGLDTPDVEAGRKALTCLRATPVIPSTPPSVTGERRATSRKAVAVVSHGVLNIQNYPGLAYYQKPKPGFFKRLLHPNPPTLQAICSHTYEPLHDTMTLLESRQHRQLAKEVFKLIQGIMGDRPLGGKEYWSDRVIGLGIHTPELRDEIYLHLVKQLTKNPNQLSEVQGWTLLLYCCQSFLPSSALRPYIRYFLHQRAHAAVGEFSGGVFDEIGETARQALHELDKLHTEEEEREARERGDVTEPEDAWKADVTIRMMDGSRQKVSIRYETTLADIIQDVCSRFNMDPVGWTIMVLTEVDDTIINVALALLRILQIDALSLKIIQSTLFALWGLPQFRVLPDALRVWDIWDTTTETFPRLVFRRRLINRSEMLYPHPHHAHLTYKQLLWEFIRYPFAERLSVLAGVVARILVAERWSPTTVVSENIVRGASGGLADYGRAAIRAMAITYAVLQHSGYIPAVYVTRHPAYQLEWEVNVQSVYKTLDTDEYQLLAINNVLTEMHRLKIFGSVYWLVIEPLGDGVDTLLAGSQLRAAYENVSVDTTPGQLLRLLTAQEQKTDTDMLQPMVITEQDINRLRTELHQEWEQKQQQQQQRALSSKKPLQTWMRKALCRDGAAYVADRELMEDLDQEGVAFSAPKTHQDTYCQPIWMAYNTDGLYFVPAVSVGQTNRLDVPHIHVPPQQLFACETLWTYHKPTQSWLYAGLLLCVNLGGTDNSPYWRLIPIVPLTASVPAVLAVLQAFLPSLHCYGEETQANQVDESDAVQEDEIMDSAEAAAAAAAVEYSNDQGDENQEEDENYYAEDYEAGVEGDEAGVEGDEAGVEGDEDQYDDAEILYQAS